METQWLVWSKEAGEGFRIETTFVLGLGFKNNRRGGDSRPPESRGHLLTLI